MDEDDLSHHFPVHPDGSFELIISEVRAISTQLHDLWRQYMSWYTFAFTANLLALSWIGLNPEFFARVDDGTLRVPALLFSLMWIFINFLNIVGCLVVNGFTGRQTKRARVLLQAAYEGSSTPPHLRVEHNFPRFVTRLAGQGNAVALLTFVGVWSYIALRAKGFDVDQVMLRLLF